MRIPIPTQDVNYVGRSIYKLYQLSQIVNQSNDNEIELHFGHTKFVNAPFATGLFCLIHQWLSAGKKVFLFRNGAVRGYLETLHFPFGLDLYNNRGLISELNQFANRHYMPITVFPCFGLWNQDNAMDACVNSLQDLIYAQLNPKGTYRLMVSHLIEENTNNVKDHSGREFGILSAQLYPSINCMDIVVADTGKGILNTYIDNKKFNTHDETQAFEFATSGKSTKDRAESRGFGITSSRHLTVKGVEGTYIIWSGNTMFAVSR